MTRYVSTALDLRAIFRRMGAVDGTAPQLSLFPPEDTFPEVERPGRPPGFSVRESARARRLSIKVYPRGKVEVVVPRRTRPRDVEAFVRENAAWIKKAREWRNLT